MPAEIENKLDYAAFLADLEAKKAVLERAIASVRAVMNGGALAVSVGDSMSMTDGLSVSVMPAGEVPRGAFLGKSIPEAAKLYLAIVKSKQTSRDIAEALLKGGIESRSKTFSTQVHSILDRASKGGSGIVKLDKSHWGLVDWYPAGVRAGLSQEKRGKRRVSKRMPKREKKEQPASGLGPQATIINLLKGGGFISAKDISQHTGIKLQTTHLLLAKLLAAKKLEKSVEGGYKLGSTI
jgi:hypothetical protein